MTGIEVAGLILAVIPLIISGLEHYADGLSTLGRYRRYKLELSRLINSLESEKAKLTNTFERLLVGIVDPWEIDPIMRNPPSTMWKDEEALEKIRLRLHKDFTVFENTVSAVHEAVQEMKDRLEIRPDGTIKWAEGSVPVRELKRVLFSLRKSKYDGIMTRIICGISTLDKLAADSIEFEPRRHIQSQGRVMKLVRDTSKSIYRALRGGLPCCDSHDLSLGLASRSANVGPNDDDRDISSQFTFRIAISNHLDAHELTTTKAWDLVVVKETSETTSAPPTPIYSRTPSPSPTPLPTPLPTPSKRREGKDNSVSFSWRVSTAVASTTSTLNCVGAQTHPMTTAFVTTAAVVPPLNLCNILCQVRKLSAQSYCGCITDCKVPTRPRDFNISLDTDGAGAHVIQSMISLRQVLENQSGRGMPQLLFVDRLYLAAVLASSVLQLHQTPWLPDILSTEDILFVHRNNQPSYRDAFVIKRNPDLPVAATPSSCSSSSAAAAATSAATATTPGWSADPAFLPRNPTVLSLGILLVEIFHGKPVRTLSTAGPSDILADYSAAQRYLNEVEQRNPGNYGSAVRQCLNYYARKNSDDQEDEHFRHYMYSKVVSPLEQDLKSVEL